MKKIKIATIALLVVLVPLALMPKQEVSSFFTDFFVALGGCLLVVGTVAATWWAWRKGCRLSWRNVIGALAITGVLLALVSMMLPSQQDQSTATINVPATSRVGRIVKMEDIDDLFERTLIDKATRSPTEVHEYMEELQGMGAKSFHKKLEPNDDPEKPGDIVDVWQLAEDGCPTGKGAWSITPNLRGVTLYVNGVAKPNLGPNDIIYADSPKLQIAGREHRYVLITCNP